MSIEASKVVAYAATGDTAGLNVAKIVVYVLLEPGAEADAPPPAAEPTQGYTYAQLLRPTPAPVPGQILLEGDEQSGTDAILLEGDEQSGTDCEQHEVG